MTILLKLAWRNLFRQKTRLILNLVLLVSAFACISMFKGFETNILFVMRKVLIDSQLGHLQVGQRSLFENNFVENAKQKLMKDPATLLADLNAIPEVQYASPRVVFYGLANTEEKSIPARFVGFDLKVETKAQKLMIFKQGRRLENPKEALIGNGLQKNLKVNAGEEITVVTQNLDGGVNAMDLKIVGVVATGFADIDKSTIFMNKNDALKVMDSDYVDRILINLKDIDSLDLVKEKIQAMTLPPGVELREWRQLSDLYLQVETFYKVQNIIIVSVLISLLLLSVSNAASMTVFERLSEIGTLRALGDYESDIRRIFLVESILLALLAIGLAAPLSYFLMIVISSFNFPLLLPLGSAPMPLHILPTVAGFVTASIACFVSVLVAGLLPAKKGSQMPIVIALRAKG